MIEFYSQIKWVHIASVLGSGGLFMLRGLLVQFGRSKLANATGVRYLSYTIDTVLLTAALMLLAVLPGAMFVNGWLTVKLVFLVVYIGLATFALKRARTPRVRLACYILAILVFCFMFTIARSHNPLGLFAPLH